MRLNADVACISGVTATRGDQADRTAASLELATVSQPTTTDSRDGPNVW